LPGFVKVGKVGGSEVLPLLVLDMLLLAVPPHLLNVPGGMLTDAGDVPVRTNDDVVSVSVLRIGVWPTAAKTIPKARWSS
jgi:hypothetical protein